MKKLFVSLITLCVIVTLASCAKSGGADTSLSDIKAKGKFVVGLDDAFPPMGFKDAKGEIVGFDIDLAKAVAAKMGIAVEFKPVAWDGIIFSLNKGDIDVIWNGLTITDERKKQIAFSVPYLDNRQIIMVKAASAFQTKADLKTKIAGHQLGSSSEAALKGDAAFASSLKDVRKYQDNQQALMDLSAGRIDAVVVDEIVGRYAMAKKPGEYRVLAETLGNELYGIGFRMKDESFRAELGKALAAVIADGTADAIAKQWFGEAIIKK